MSAWQRSRHRPLGGRASTRGRRGAAAQRRDDTDVDLDREALLRLARELAEKRHADQEHAGAELEQLKQSLRERAEAIAARERELAELQKRLGEGKPRKQEQPRAGGRREALVARERAALERAQALEARERELQARAAELEAERAGRAARRASSPPSSRARSRSRRVAVGARARERRARRSSRNARSRRAASRRSSPHAGSSSRRSASGSRPAHASRDADRALGAPPSRSRPATAAARERATPARGEARDARARARARPPGPRRGAQRAARARARAAPPRGRRRAADVRPAACAAELQRRPRRVRQLRARATELPRYGGCYRRSACRPAVRRAHSPCPSTSNPVDPPDLGLLPTFRRLLRLWWGERRLGALGLSLALAYTLISIAIPLLMQRAIDNAIVTHTQPLWPYVLAIVALAAVRFGVNFSRRYATARIGIRIEARMRELLYQRLSPLPARVLRPARDGAGALARDERPLPDPLLHRLGARAGDAEPDDDRRRRDRARDRQPAARALHRGRDAADHRARAALRAARARRSRARCRSARAT